MPQSSCVRFLWNAKKLYLSTWRHIPKEYLHGYRPWLSSCDNSENGRFFFLSSRPSTSQTVHFPGKRGVFMAGLVTFGGECTTVRPLRMPCQSWSLNSLLLVPFVGESAGEILSAAVYRKYWICFHYVWASQPDCSPLYEWHALTYIAALAFPAYCLYCRIQGHLLQLVKRPEHDGRLKNIWRRSRLNQSGAIKLHRIMEFIVLIIVFFNNLVVIS